MSDLGAELARKKADVLAKSAEVGPQGNCLAVLRGMDAGLSEAAASGQVSSRTVANQVAELDASQQALKTAKESVPLLRVRLRRSLGSLVAYRFPMTKSAVGCPRLSQTMFWPTVNAGTTAYGCRRCVYSPVLPRRSSGPRLSIHSRTWGPQWTGF